MSEEIFDPILPVIEFQQVDQAIEQINQRTKPFEYILKHTSAGGTCINDSSLLAMNLHLPFGVVNTSGMGVISWTV